MAKDKKGSKAAASAPKTEVAKPLENIKAGRVTKPIEQAKASAKQTAKKAAEGVEKTSKKVKKAIEPESSDDDSDVTSDSSASSDEEEVETKAAPKLNGKANGKAAKANDSSSEEESDSDEESDDEVADKKVSAPKTNGAAKDDDSDDDSSEASDSDEDEAPKVNGKAAAATADSDEEDDDDDDDSSEASDSDDEVDAKAGAKKAADVDDDDSDADSSDASSSDDEEEVAKPVAKETGKKRKAEDAIEQTPKKTKATVEGELKDATPNLFVGNLSWNVDEDWLTREFESFGELASVRIITDRDSGRSKGFGYVEFNNAEKAAEALEAMQGAQIDGREIRVDFSVPRQNRAEGQTPQQRSFDRAQKYGDTPKEPSATLFVGNVSFDSDESTLTDLFQEHGTVKGVRLPTDRESGQMKGFGYVEFYDIEEAKAAFEALQGAELGGRALRLDYSTPRSNDSPGGRGGRGGGDRGGFRGGFRGGDRGGRGGGRGGFGDRGRGRGGARGGRGNTTNRGGFGDFSGKKMTF